VCGPPFDPYLGEPEEAKLERPPLVAEEELAVVERYTGLNRFRARFRR
jgi:hypothetical protein